MQATMNNNTSSSTNFFPKRENDSFLEDPKVTVCFISSGDDGIKSLVPYDGDSSDSDGDEDDCSFKRKITLFHHDPLSTKLPRNHEEEQTFETDPLIVPTTTEDLRIRRPRRNHRFSWWSKPYTLARRKFSSMAESATSSSSSSDKDESCNGSGKMLSKVIIPRPSSVDAARVVAPIFEPEEEPMEEICVHRPKVGALCIDQDGYTVSDGVVSISRDYKILDGWKCKLVKDLEQLELQKLFLVDAHTERFFRTVESLLPRHFRASSKTTSFGFIDPMGSERYRRPCDACKNMRCHRWRAIRYGMQILVRYEVSPIPH